MGLTSDASIDGVPNTPSIARLSCPHTTAPLTAHLTFKAAEILIRKRISH
jgi:hypothetical protein